MINAKLFRPVDSRFQDALPYLEDDEFKLLADDVSSTPLCLSCPAQLQTASGTWELVYARSDTYCARSIINVPLVQKLALDVYMARDAINLFPKWDPKSFTCNHALILPIFINGKSTRVLAYVVGADESKLVLGTDYLICIK